MSGQRPWARATCALKSFKIQKSLEETGTMKIDNWDWPEIGAVVCRPGKHVVQVLRRGPKRPSESHLTSILFRLPFWRFMDWIDKLFTKKG